MILDHKYTKRALEKMNFQGQKTKRNYHKSDAYET